MQYRKYNPKKDKEAVHTIWKEVGWVIGNDYKPMDHLIENSLTIVADVSRRPECLVTSWFGDMMYQREKIRFSCIAGVTTSLVARKQKLAGKLTALKIAQDAAEGAEVSGLGMFEQGFYDKLGYGTGSYEHILKFAPATLNVNSTPRVPIRLDKNDWKMVHNCRLKRMRRHGSCISNHPAPTRAEMGWAKSGFGYGYKNRAGQLTHFIWMDGKGKEYGPFEIWIMAYQTYDQFRELLALLKSFGEQVHLVWIIEPPNIHIQDFLTKPFKYRTITEKSKYENIMRASAWWQMRVCDLEGCLRKTKLNCDEVEFNLRLHDPIEDFLDHDAPWHGISGDYVITLGKKSKAHKGTAKGLPTLEAGVGAFTRMWLGCLNASSLAASDKLKGPQALLDRLDSALRLPKPLPDWPF
jgi:predicted acetyltransferase